MLAQREGRKERALAASRRYRDKRKDDEVYKARVRAQNAEWRAAHPGRDKEYYGLHKEARRSSRAKWAAENQHVLAANVAKYKAAKLHRTPSWADFSEIEKVYAEARRLSESTGEPWQVDHVVPLQGKTVSGLHVHYNLQVLRAKDNASKHARFEPC